MWFLKYSIILHRWFFKMKLKFQYFQKKKIILHPYNSKTLWLWLIVWFSIFLLCLNFSSDFSPSSSVFSLVWNILWNNKNNWITIEKFDCKTFPLEILFLFLWTSTFYNMRSKVSDKTWKYFMILTIEVWFLSNM